jgi:ribosomal protein S18 acetylase RimI-like enzyme
MKEKVKTTYLELRREDRFVPSEGYLEETEVKEIGNDFYLSFVLFAGVGIPWRWYSRFKWSVSQWEDYFSGRQVKTFIVFGGNKLIGYYELEMTSTDVEIKFLGLFPCHIGSGFGGMLLSRAVDSAREQNASTIWLHTCSNDSKSALSNYIARGFRICREEENFEEVPEKEEILKGIASFYAQYIEMYTNQPPV